MIRISKQQVCVPALLALLVLTAGCRSTEPAGPADPPAGPNQTTEALLGLWAVRAGEGGSERSLGSLRLQRGEAGRDVRGELFPVEGTSRGPLSVSLVSGSLHASSSSAPLELTVRPVAGAGFDPTAPEWHEALSGELRVATRRTPVRLERLTTTCPVCALESPVESPFCPGCGVRLRLPGGLDVRLAWAPEAERLFEAEALEHALRPHLRGAHKVVVADCDFQLRDQRVTWDRVALWAFLGILSGFQSWEYELSATLTVDLQPAAPFRSGPIELDFFDRHEGLRELALAAVSWIYPAPLLEHDPEVTAKVALARLTEACLQRLGDQK